MPCYHPLPAWYSRTVNPSGKRGITFSMNDGFKDKPLEVPCGTCIGCKLERARQWSVRCMHEVKLWPDSCFVTLTYDDSSLPTNYSLVPERFVLFMKRLRKAKGPGVRFFHCGEYGDVTDRPHHHALLFNCAFPDRVFHSGGSDGSPRLYTSERLDSLWGYGHCTIGEANFESAGYIARYTLKKVVGSGADLYYNGRVPEYLTMSRRPGIGSAWAKLHRSDWYPSDSVVVNGVKTRPPRYYDGICEKLSPSVLRRVKARRRIEAAEDPDSTGSRLIVREAVKRSAVSTLSRKDV